MPDLNPIGAGNQTPIQNNQVDPNFAPNDSNIYIRTMNTDLSNLKEQGGEAMPFANQTQGTNLNATLNSAPVAQAPVVQASVEPTNPVMPEIAPIINPVPAVEPIASPIPNGTTVDTLQQKMDALGVQTSVPAAPSMQPGTMTPETPAPISFEEPVIATPTPVAPANPMSSINNLSSDLNNLITPEEFSPITSVNPEVKTGGNKKKIIMIAIILGIVVLAGVVGFIVIPAITQPKVMDLKQPGTPLPTIMTTTTIPPAPFLKIKEPFEMVVVNADASKATTMVELITTEGKKLSTPDAFKVIVPKLQNQYLTSREILDLFIPNAPQSLKDSLDKDYLVYTFYGATHPGLGLVFNLKASTNASTTTTTIASTSTSTIASTTTTTKSTKSPVELDFLTWETNKNIIKDTLNLWLFSPKTTKTKAFKASEVLGARVRTFTYPEKEAALTYGFLNNYVIVTTSLEAMTSALTHIEGGDTMVIK